MYVLPDHANLILPTLMVSNTQNYVSILKTFPKNAATKYPTHIAKACTTKGLAAPKEAMYILLESSAEAFAGFTLPSLDSNNTYFVQGNGLKLPVTLQDNKHSPRQGGCATLTPEVSGSRRPIRI